VPDGTQSDEAYWSDRLNRDFNLRGTGHISYSQAYNSWLYRAKRRAFRKALSGARVSGRPALDVGSGTGWVVSELLEAGADVQGSDLTKVSVQGLREAFPGVTFHRLQIGRDQVPCADGSFELVTALDVLYHVTDDASWSAAVQELTRVLAPGGRLIFTDGLGSEEEDRADHVRLRSRGTWETEAYRCGLRFHSVLPLYRWISRDQSRGPLAHLPDSLRGPVEYGLERLVPVRPHMRCAVLVRDGVAEAQGS
jgi:SAM-dependent methyltransferase